MKLLYLILVLLSVIPAARAQQVNPRACDASVIVTGGTAVTAVAGQSNGYYIFNPLSATDQGIATAEVLFLDTTTAAAAASGGTVLALPPGTPFYGIPTAKTNVSANAATSSHKFTCVRW